MGNYGNFNNIGEKKTPFLNFKLIIPFSISAERSIADAFYLKAANENLEKTRKLKEFHFKKLSENLKTEIRDERDLHKIPGILEALDLARESIKKAMGATNMRNYSKMIKEEFVLPYLKKKSKNVM